jgi:hypothetical protein
MAKTTQKVIFHRGGMRPGTPDSGTVRPKAAPADKGGEWQHKSNSNGTVRSHNTGSKKQSK